MSEKRSSFTGKLGFVLAAAGSAVGLGNIWRFPYLAAKYGGGIFLLVYIVLSVTFGFALMTAEIAIGRKTGTSAINAFKKLDKRFGFVGWIAALVPT
ncbi:MAG: sodium-dependent transporter, partial [Acutalibacteraceae bacterium]|nr:sodium-dependent transporter [Acutalibacteraceae bacterium]